MGKYVIALCIGILIGNVLRRFFEKHWMDIFIGIMYVAMFVLIAPLYVITFPIRVFNTIRNNYVTEKKVIREYDRIFFEAGTMEKVSKINRRIEKFQSVLEKKAKKQKEKEAKKTLTDAKWLL